MFFKLDTATRCRTNGRLPLGVASHTPCTTNRHTGYPTIPASTAFGADTARGVACWRARRSPRLAHALAPPPGRLHSSTSAEGRGAHRALFTIHTATMQPTTTPHADPAPRPRRKDSSWKSGGGGGWGHGGTRQLSAWPILWMDMETQEAHG